MAYIGRSQFTESLKDSHLTTDGSTTTFTLNYSIGSAGSILVNVAGVQQEALLLYLY